MVQRGVCLPHALMRRQRDGGEGSEPASEHAYDVTRYDEHGAYVSGSDKVLGDDCRGSPELHGHVLDAVEDVHDQRQNKACHVDAVSCRSEVSSRQVGCVLFLCVR